MFFDHMILVITWHKTASRPAALELCGCHNYPQTHRPSCTTAHCWPAKKGVQFWRETAGFLHNTKGRKLPNQEYTKINAIEPRRRPAPPKPWLPVTLLGKFVFPNTHFPCQEGSCSLPLCSRKSVLQDRCPHCEPRWHIRSRGGGLQLCQTCMAEDPSTQGTPQTTERPRGLRNDPQLPH